MDPKISLQQRPYELDDSVRSRAAIGLVVLATDHVIEHEFRKILNLPGVGLYQSRILNEPSINPETLSAMESRLEDSVRVILPVNAPRCDRLRMHLGLDGDRTRAG